MIGKNSRYAACILLQDSGGDSLGTRPRIDTTARYDDRFHTVTDGDRLDLIAHQYLGDARLWWIIADYNDIFFPLDLTPGAVLRIPSVEHVQMRILP
jgi:nucleoid-associated protein YgaU